MRRYALPLLIVFAAAVVATAVVSAGEKHAAVKGGKECSPLPVEVRSQVQKLTLQHRLDNVDLNARRMELQGQMKQELLRDKPDSKQLDKIAKEMDGVRTKLHRQRIEYLLKVKQVLPAEHWKVFLHKQCGSFAGGCCLHGAGCTHGAAGHGHGAECTHGAAGHGHGAGCTHGAAGSKHDAGAGCPMTKPAGTDAELCPSGKHDKSKR